MTPKEYEEKVSEAAEAIENESLVDYSGDAISFERGVQWCRDNPPPEVMALIEALKKAKHKIICINAGCHKGRCYYCEAATAAAEALEAFENRKKDK
jgi:hypothetical protein